MPHRKFPLINGQIYHVINRGVASIPIFRNKKDYIHFTNTFSYYQFQNPPIRFSVFMKLSNQRRTEIIESRSNDTKNVSILAYCLMPNHFHFLLKQLKDNGIREFSRLASDSFAKYINTKYARKGPLMEGRFKNVLIETDDQILHVQRYIHLNPYSSYIVKDFSQLIDYRFSSLGEYLEKSKNTIIDKTLIMHLFGNNQSKFRNFIQDHADYQRNLDIIKHKILE